MQKCCCHSVLQEICQYTPWYTFNLTAVKGIGFCFSVVKQAARGSRVGETHKAEALRGWEPHQTCLQYLQLHPVRTTPRGRLYQTRYKQWAVNLQARKDKVERTGGGEMVRVCNTSIKEPNVKISEMWTGWQHVNSLKLPW